jgi:hypothetical protein
MHSQSLEPRVIAALPRRAAALLAAVGLGAGLTACGTASSVSTGSYTGESHAVAQRISDFQADASSGQESKLCEDDVAAAVQARLKAAGGECKKAFEKQLGEIDNFDLTIASIKLEGAIARAQVKATYAGKSRLGTIRLVKEGGAWKVSAVS